MGTAVELLVPASMHKSHIDRAFSWLRWVDVTFSTYRDDSEISKVRRGELSLSEASAAVQDVVARCETISKATEGWFTAYEGESRERQALDPTGLVKGWSVDCVAARLRELAPTGFAINAGGDVVCAGSSSARARWRIGVQHPHHPGEAAIVLHASELAVATAGAYERGEHVWSIRALDSASKKLLSATVIGPELGTADALATAVFACHGSQSGWLDRFPRYSVLLIDEEERVSWSPGFERYLA